MRKYMSLSLLSLLLCGGCLGAGCMPTEKSEQERWKQAQDSDAAERASVRATMEENRKVSTQEHAALSQQVTKEHTIQTPEKMDALAGAQAAFAAQVKVITDAAAMAIEKANKAADDRIAVVLKANSEMPKNPMGSEAMTAIGTVLASIAGAFGVAKMSPSKASSEASAKAIAALNAKVGLPVTA